MRIILSIIVLFLFAGCSSPQLKVERYADYDSSESSFVLITKTYYDPDFRSAMHLQGFKLLKFASQKTIVQNKSIEDRKEIFKETQTRYGISLVCDLIDVNIFSSKVKIDVAVEITDIIKNEVVLVVKKGGWSNVVFNQLAEEIKKQWH